MTLQKRGASYRFARQTSLCVAITGLILTLLISPSAYAVQGVNYKPQSIGENWSPYNQEPSGGYSVESFGERDKTLRMGVNTSAATSLGQLEGLKRTVSSSDTIRASLYVDNAWKTTEVRTGLSVKGMSDDHTVIEDVRVEFIRSDGFTGWRIENESGWTNITSSYIQNDWNELELVIGKQSGKIEAYINGVVADISSVHIVDYLSEVTISNYNFGLSSQDYDSHWSKLETGHYDNAPPAISFLAPAAIDEVMKETDYVSVSASDETMLHQVGIKIYDVDGNVVRENAPLVTGTDCRLDISLAGLTDGWYRIDASATDGASNVSQTLSRSFAIDSSGPQITITSPFKDIVSGAVSVKGTMSDAHLYQYDSVIKNADGAVVAGPGVVVADSVSEWQWNTNIYPDGVYTIVLAGDDTVGNHSETTKDVYVDNTAPIVTLDSFDAAIAAGEMVIFTGNINDTDAHVVLSVDGTSYPVTEVQDGKWRHVFVNGLTAGRHTVGVVATDGSGNTSSINSSPLSMREVNVASADIGSGALLTKPFIDTTTLFKAVTTPGAVSSTTPLEGLDSSRMSPMHATANVESPSVALAPTENGWKLLGILWYWWVLSLLLVTGVGWYIAVKWWRRSRPGMLAD